jgi:hypothetical protein
MAAKMDRFRKVFAARIKSLFLAMAGASGEAAEPLQERAF